MRLSAILAFTLLALPAAAADSIADQAQSAFATFAGGKAQLDFNLGRYGTVSLRDIAGTWVSLAGPAAGTGRVTPTSKKVAGGSRSGARTAARTISGADKRLYQPRWR